MVKSKVAEYGITFCMNFCHQNNLISLSVITVSILEIIMD